MFYYATVRIKLANYMTNSNDEVTLHAKSVWKYANMWDK